eukprot:Colp12_sorted_trinity150504_noHs@10195
MLRELYILRKAEIESQTQPLELEPYTIPKEVLECPSELAACLKAEISALQARRCRLVAEQRGPKADSTNLLPDRQVVEHEKPTQVVNSATHVHRGRRLQEVTVLRPFLPTIPATASATQGVHRTNRHSNALSASLEKDSSAYYEQSLFIDHFNVPHACFSVHKLMCTSSWSLSGYVKWVSGNCIEVEVRGTEHGLASFLYSLEEESKNYQFELTASRKVPSSDKLRSPPKCFPAVQTVKDTIAKRRCMSHSTEFLRQDSDFLGNRKQSIGSVASDVTSVKSLPIEGPYSNASFSYYETAPSWLFT